MDCEVEMHRSSVLGLSPSFNSYDSGRLAEIAARILEELGDSGFPSDMEAGNSGDEGSPLFSLVDGGPHGGDECVKEDGVDSEGEGCGGDDDNDDDSEFAFVWIEPATSPISADEIFYNGQIRPLFPIFNRNLLPGEKENKGASGKPPSPASTRLPLRKLLIEERGTASCSWSEAEELEGVPPGTYCVWSPKLAESTPGRCRKSNSTGSSKRWKFRDFLHRSNSEGKDTLIFLGTPSSTMKKKKAGQESAATEKTKAKAESEETETTPTNHGRNNESGKKEGERRRSYLPYRQDLVGFFTNVNGLSRNLHPF